MRLLPPTDTGDNLFLSFYLFGQPTVLISVPVTVFIWHFLLRSHEHFALKKKQKKKNGATKFD